MTIDNKYVVSGSEDKTIRNWNLLEKRQESILQLNTSILSLAVTRNNKFIVSCLSDNEVRIWKLLKRDNETF